ncbi:hypothetical protein KDL01_04280 [Actinospica durhamensis]|uniref:Uncharacterized protein n=1 Tax=Actinospica durhamensis TaxID=1508375 RepID=A0A941EH20_9ACTN|nr:hypothetical protein [Actinospica durhamensis]MBR7832460.1 hypothetical protein [Actinospica durhamensis]
MTETEITTGAERAQTDTAEPTLTISELRALLRDATAYAAAQRPIVLHAPAEPVTATQTAPAGHAGITVAVPAATAIQDAPERRYSIHELVGHCGMAVAGTGFITAILLAVAGSPDITTAAVAGVAGLAVSFGAAVTGTNADDRAQAASWAKRQETHQ